MVLFFKCDPSSSHILPLVVLGFIWTLIVLMIGVGYSLHHDYYGPSGYWCWIITPYLPAQLATEYGWMWLTVVVGLILYVPLFFSLRGNIIVTGWKASWKRLESTERWVATSGCRDSTIAARSLVW